jgi:hypothetical protein
MRGSASPIEITWTAVALCGVLLTVWMIVDVYLDYRFVRRGIRAGIAVAYGPRWWIAVGALVGNGLTLLVWLGFLVVGLLAMQFPPPPPNTEQGVVSMVIGWVLIAMEALLASVQVWSRIVRLKVAASQHAREPELPS